jgi:hypothetical protein
LCISIINSVTKVGGQSPRRSLLTKVRGQSPRRSLLIKSNVLKTKIRGLGFIVGYVYYDFDLQGRRLRVARKGVLGLGWTLVHLYCDFALQGRRLRVV